MIKGSYDLGLVSGLLLSKFESFLTFNDFISVLWLDFVLDWNANWKIITERGGICSMHFHLFLYSFITGYSR